VAWLRAIALNKIRDRARRAAVRRGFWGTTFTDADRVADDGASPESAVIARDQAKKLVAALDRLPPPLREALMLTAVDGLSQAAAAAALDCSVKAIEYRVHRAREMLARELGL
jgi:RNA polymerase sigma-70 factor (ECF subfamily)